jgi:hypothetical protein
MGRCQSVLDSMLERKERCWTFRSSGNGSILLYPPHERPIAESHELIGPYLVQNVFDWLASNVSLSLSSFDTFDILTHYLSLLAPQASGSASKALVGFSTPEFGSPWYRMAILAVPNQVSRTNRPKFSSLYC